MFAVGHMALAYLLSKTSAKGLKVNVIVPAVFVLSIIPDIDILFGGEFHRGPTHSSIVALVIFIPFFIIYRRKTVPYFLALLSHGLIGDLLIGGDLQLLWPITSREIYLSPWLPTITINSRINIALETTLFVIATIVMVKTKDSRIFFSKNKSNLLLLIPITTVLLPTLVAYPLIVPILLTPPHLFYLVLFTIALFAAVLGFLKGKKHQIFP